PHIILGARDPEGPVYRMTYIFAFSESMDELRRQVLSNTDGEERVEVNQRHLIDKILASHDIKAYQCNYFKDDAKSTSVQIIFETQKSSNATEINILKDKCVRILFKNNGFEFRPEDWNRLKKIAEGNPDEQKGFTGNLREISVFFNDKRIIHLTKKMSDPRPMNIISGLSTTSPQKMFSLRSVDVRQVQLDVVRLLIPKKNTRSKMGLSEYPKEEASMYLRVASGHLDVRVTKAFSNEMERSTKKKPPSTTSIHIIFSGYDEHSYSSDRNEKVSDIFKNLLPYPEQGRIFIGFPTHQTTGCSSHLSARLIPTVERESIDLVDKTLAVYNNEMLCLVGILCRILYEDEMAQISKLYNEIVGSSPIDSKDEAIKSGREYFERKAAHALAHFTFKPSTPNAYVGRIAELQFYKCSTKPISILSTRGVQPADLIRLPNPEMEAFIKSVPVIPKILMEQCDAFIKKTRDTMGLIKDIKINDVFVELQSRALTKEETVALMKWWISYRKKEKSSENELHQLLRSTVIRVKDDEILPLNKVRYFLNPSVIAPENDVPSDVLQYSISRNFQKADLEKWFGEWKELSLVTWSQFIVSNPQLETDPDVAEKVLGIIARSFGKCSNKDQELIKELLSRKKCIPTKHGMKIPDEAYFPSVNLFPDLPIVYFKNMKTPEKLLQSLGVRKHVDLQLVFDRLVSQGNWDHMQLVKYLSSVSSSLKEIEMKRLKLTAIWPKEQGVETQVTKDEVKPKVSRFTASELYIPSQEMRKFGLPIIEWNGKWHRNSEEAKFLLSLGLQEYPPLTIILQLASPNSEPNIRKEALKYFINNFKDKYSSKYNAREIKIPFLQCTDPNVFETPLGCFSNPDCTIMKFHALHHDLRFRAEELGVRQHPSREQLLDRLIQHPLESETEAREVFGYLSSQLANFNSYDWDSLGNLKFIPIRNKNQPNKISYVSPRNCFFKSSEESFSEYFSYVDFGEKANRFLLSCGVKTEPSPTEFAEFLVRSSREFWNTIGDNVEKYLSILRNIAFNSNSIFKNKNLFYEMGRAPILLGVKRKESDKELADNSLQEIDHYVLASAKDIYINDNTNYQQVFSPLTAPMEQTLEKFYQELGSRSLYSCVRESIQPKGQITTSRQAVDLKKMINQRAQLFYHDIHRSDIKRPVQWVRELKVMEIERIDATYVLVTTNETKIEQISSCIVEDTRSKSWILYVTPGDPDYLDIASHLGQNIFIKSKWKDISHLAMLLTTPLTSLKRKGYPVDRILASHKTPVRIADKYESPKSPRSAGKINSPGSSSEIEQYVKQIQETYPDCDPAFIRRILAQEKFDLNKVANNLADMDYPKISKSPYNPNNYGSDGLKNNGWGIFDKVKSYVTSTAGANVQAPIRSQQTVESKSNVGESSPVTKPIDVNPGTTKNLQDVLRRAVKMCRSNSGSAIDSRATVNHVTESQISYCDVLPGNINIFDQKGKTRMT
ncbi:7915_t:CDS:10, partial [Acaulospora colombiana]